MAPPLRTAVRSRWSPRRSTVLALALALLAVGCTSRDERPLIGGNAGSTDQGRDAGAGAGASGGSTTTGRAGAGARGGSTGDGGDPGGLAQVASQGTKTIPPGGGSDEGARRRRGRRRHKLARGGSGAAGGEGGTGGEGGAATDPPPSDPSGLPCEVETVLRKRCQSCHSRHPASAAIVPLLTLRGPHCKVEGRSLRHRRCSFSEANHRQRISDAASAGQTSNQRGDRDPASVGSRRGSPRVAATEGAGRATRTMCHPSARVTTTGPEGTSGSPWMMPGARLHRLPQDHEQSRAALRRRGDRLSHRPRTRHLLRGPGHGGRGGDHH